MAVFLVAVVEIGAKNYKGKILLYKESLQIETDEHIRKMLFLGQRVKADTGSGIYIKPMKAALSFMSANLVARELQWNMTRGWSEGQTATEDWFRPQETFADRFEQMLAPIAASGFAAIDLWLGHLNPAWASDRQIDDAARILTNFNLKVTSLAGYVPNDRTVQQRLLAMARRLGTDLFAGNWEILAQDRPECLRILRAGGLRLAYENHAESSAQAVLDLLGPADRDVLGVAVDTGWFASQGADVLAQMKLLKDRIFHVHLKDIFPPVKTDAGTLKAMGHQTCALGRGIVAIPAIYDWLKAALPQVPLSIEHEPEDHDPMPEIAEGVRLVKILDSPAVNAAVIGCGNIAKTYLEQLRQFRPLRLTGFFDADQDRSRAYAGQFGGRSYTSEAELLADPSVELVINLTIPSAHFDITARALRAGKHVFSEKPFAPTWQQARELTELARTHGVLLASAPITYLGEAQEQALAVVASGQLGTVCLGYAELNQGPIESWHPAPESFYQVGIAWDVGIYPLTLLTCALGSVVGVEAIGRILKQDRERSDGKPFKVTTPDWILAVIEFACGTFVRLSANYFATGNRQGTSVELHGDKGQLFLGSSYMYDAVVERKLAGREVEDLTPARSFQGIDFSRGVKEMACLIRTGESRLAPLGVAEHVIDVLEAIDISLKEGRSISVKSRL